MKKTFLVTLVCGVTLSCGTSEELTLKSEGTGKTQPSSDKETSPKKEEKDGNVQSPQDPVVVNPPQDTDKDGSGKEQQKKTGALTIKLSGHPLSDGLNKRIYISMFNENFAGDFSDPDSQNFAFAGKVEAQDGTFTLANLKPGRFAISLYVDEDGNGELNTKEIFMQKLPVEPFGFSNNISGGLENLPKLLKFAGKSATERFRDASFTIQAGQNTVLEITLEKLEI